MADRCQMCGDSGWVIETNPTQDPERLEVIPCILPGCRASGRPVEAIELPLEWMHRVRIDWWQGAAGVAHRGELEAVRLIEEARMLAMSTDGAIWQAWTDRARGFLASITKGTASASRPVSDPS